MRTVEQLFALALPKRSQARAQYVNVPRRRLRGRHGNEAWAPKRRSGEKTEPTSLPARITVRRTRTSPRSSEAEKRSGTTWPARPALASALTVGGDRARGVSGVRWAPPSG